MNKKLMRKLGFDAEVEKVETGKCPMCGCSVRESDFKDELSKEEFKISGMCQKCQDKVFS